MRWTVQKPRFSRGKKSGLRGDKFVTYLELEPGRRQGARRDRSQVCISAPVTAGSSPPGPIGRFTIDATPEAP